MKLLDRITQQIINSEELLHLDAIIPQRYILAEDWKYRANYTIPKGTILFSDGASIKFETTQSISCIEIELSETVQHSITIIAQNVHQALLQQDFDLLPSPLIPSQVFDSTAQLTELENMLAQILEAGHLHQIAHRPRMDMRYDEELVDISRAKKIANNAHRHLAIHSETWQQRTLVGIHPKKILARLSEDEIAIYENKVFVSLLDKLRYFLISRLNELQQQQENLTEALHLGDASNIFYKLRYVLCELWAENSTDAKSILQQLESTIQRNKTLLEKIKGLQTFGLYIKIPMNLRRIPDQLHKTNILAHDQHYRHLSRLWSEIYSQQKRFPNIEEKLESFNKLQSDYNQYTLLIVLRAFLNLSFSITSHNKDFLLSRDTLRLILKVNNTTQNFEVINRNIETPSLKLVSIANILTKNMISNLGKDTIIFSLDKESENLNWTSYKHIIWANPFNFRAIEIFTISLLEWIYKPFLQGYSKSLNLGRIPKSVNTTLNTIIPLSLKGSSYYLIDTLSAKDLQVLQNSCEQANTHHIYDEIFSEHENLLTFKQCPICKADTAFEPRTTNQTFIATCLNSQCAIEYKLITNDEGIKSFSLNAHEDNSLDSGRWSLNFTVTV